MNFSNKLLMLIGLLFVSTQSVAQESQQPVSAPIAAPASETVAPPVANDDQTVAQSATEADSGPEYVPMDAVEGFGMPTSAEDDIIASMDFQDQKSDLGQEAYRINNYILLPIITVISLFVLALLFWVIVRYRRKANPVPSKTTHNTLVEILWTGIPILILIGISVPSIGLLAKQFEPAPQNAVTVKAVGYQWYWGFEYPDHGGIEIIANMLKEESDAAEGERFRTDADGPALLATDNRMVVPVGVPIRLQTTAADVIHSFAIPSLWFKLDAVPGRLNEKALTINEPGVYFGQCSELCGARHGFMPIAIEALPPAEFANWVKSQGGTMPNEAIAEASPEAEEATAENNETAPVAG